MGNDSLNQWYQLNGILPVSDWHPPMVLHIWKLLNGVLEGPASLLVLQLLMYWIGIGLVVQSFFAKRAKHIKFVALTTIGFFPVTWLMMASIWKDALMLSSLLFSLGLFLSARESVKANGKAIWILPIIWLCFVLTCGTRHNAIMALIPLVFMMTFDLMSASRSWYLKILLSCALLFSLAFASKRVNQIGVEVHYPYLVNQLIFWNLAGLSIDNDEILIPESAFVNPDSAKVDVLKRYYSDATNNHLVFNSGIIEPAVWKDSDYGKWFFEQGVRTIILHPKDYIEMRVRSLGHLAGIGKFMPHMAYIFETKYWPGDESLGLESYSMLNETILFEIKDKLLSRLSHVGFYNIVPYLFLLLSLLLFLAFSYKQEDRCILIGIGLSGLLYWLPYVLIAPSNDFRYNNWTVEAVVLIISTLVINKIRIRSKSSQ